MREKKPRKKQQDNRLKKKELPLKKPQERPKLHNSKLKKKKDLLHKEK